MFHTRLFKQFFTLLFLVGLFFQIGLIFYFNWTTWWFDVVMHFFAGVLIAFAVIIIWNSLRNIITVNRRKIIMVTFLSVIIIGVLWEIFELYFGLASFVDGIRYVLDTIKDIILDISGGFLGTLYGLKIMSKNI